MSEIRQKADNVSVIIVNWNAGALLERCVGGLLLQTLSPKEIIIVDNASSDGSIENIDSKFPQVRIIHAGCNLGFAEANNLASRYVSVESDWLALLNPDAFPEPQWLESLQNAAFRNPEYAFFASCLLDGDDDAVMDGIGDIYHCSGLVWRHGHGKLLNETALFQAEIFSPCAAAAMYHKQVFLDVGGFDQDFFCYVEDVDLGFRLRMLGYRCLYVPDSKVRHIGSALTGKRSDFSVYHGHRNLVWAFVKNMPGPLLWCLLPFHFLLNFASIVFFVFRGQGEVILRAKWDAIKGLPNIWRKRRLIQAKRVVSIWDIWKIIDKSILFR